MHFDTPCTGFSIAKHGGGKSADFSCECARFISDQLAFAACATFPGPLKIHGRQPCGGYHPSQDSHRRLEFTLQSSTCAASAPLGSNRHASCQTCLSGRCASHTADVLDTSTCRDWCGFALGRRLGLPPSQGATLHSLPGSGPRSWWQPLQLKASHSMGLHYCEKTGKIA